MCTGLDQWVTLAENNGIWCRRSWRRAPPMVMQYVLRGECGMSSWEKWVNRPQTLWLPRRLFPVHVWALDLLFSREPRFSAGPGARMTVDGLKQTAKRAFPEYEATRVYERKNP